MGPEFVRASRNEVLARVVRRCRWCDGFSANAGRTANEQRGRRGSGRALRLADLIVLRRPPVTRR